jgi:tetratricopeptide (TPR) repeat protein
MTDKKTESLEEEAKAALRKMFPSEWITEDMSPEHPENIRVDIVEGAHPTGTSFVVHVKAAKRVRRHRGAISTQIDTEHLLRYEVSPIPVLIIHWTESNGRLNYLSAQKLVHEHISPKDPGWQEAKSTKIKFPADSELKDAVQLKSAVVDAFFYLIDRELKKGPEPCAPQFWLGDVPVSANGELKQRMLKALSSIMQGKNRDAMDELESMLRVCIISPTEKASILISLGNAHFALSNYTEAQKDYSAALELLDRLEKEDTKEAQSVALANAGAAYFEMGDTEAALKYLQDAMTIQRDIKCMVREASVLGCICQVHKAMSDLDRALKFSQHALRVAGESGSKFEEANQLCNVAVICSERGDMEKALSHLQDALRIDKETNYRVGQAYHLGNIGLIYRSTGDLDSALNYLTDALSTDREIGYRQGEERHLSSIALIHRAKGDLDTAAQYMEDALSINREIGNRKGEATLVAHIGVVHEAKGDLDQALEHLEQALSIAREIRHKQGEANYLGNIGLIHFDRGNFEKALDCLQDALAIHRQIGYKQGEASGLGNIGLVYEAKGDLDNALKNLEDALAILVQYDLKHGRKIIENAIRELQQQKNDMD